MIAVRAVDVDLVKNSGLFDGAWYVDEYPDVQALRMDPAEHYLAFGAKLGRNPSPDFDAKAYLAANDDARVGGVNPLLHYLASNGAAALSPSEGVDGYAAVDSAKEEPDIPHYGLNFHRMIEAAWARTKPPGTSPEYDLIKTNFDMAFYLMRYVDIARALRLDPVQHYITYGAKEGRNPTPYFSTKYYVERYPDVKASGKNPFYHWLTVGRAEGRVALPFPAFDDFCGLLNRSPSEVQAEHLAQRSDFTHRLRHGVLGQMVAKAGELEPLVHQSWKEALDIKMPPLHSALVVARMRAMHRLHVAAEYRRARAVVAIRACRVSGAAKIAGYLANALADMYGPEEVVVVRTDTSDMLFPEWFPARCRHVDFAEAIGGVDGIGAEHLLVEFLRSLRAEVVFNANSRVLWDAMKVYGQSLAASTRLFAYLYCNEKDIYGNWVGYPNRNFYRYFDLLEGVATDSTFLEDDLRARFFVSPDKSAKLVTLHTPVVKSPPIAPCPSYESKSRKRQVFWAGRFDRQKRVDVAFAIAGRMPDVDFRMWGEPVLDKEFEQLKRPENITFEGVFSDVFSLPFEQCDLWLYTAEWDGVPNMLIEIAALGVPLVGSIAGGTGDVLVEGLAERVEDIEDVDAYVRAIRAVLENPRKARERAVRLRDRVLQQRSMDKYRADVATLVSREGDA
jgi:glycosyltransferase involved in cell wall biosynthesis